MKGSRNDSSNLASIKMSSRSSSCAAADRRLSRKSSKTYFAHSSADRQCLVIAGHGGLEALLLGYGFRYGRSPANPRESGAVECVAIRRRQDRDAADKTDKHCQTSSFRDIAETRENAAATGRGVDDLDETRSSELRK